MRQVQGSNEKDQDKLIAIRNSKAMKSPRKTPVKHKIKLSSSERQKVQNSPRENFQGTKLNSWV